MNRYFLYIFLFIFIAGFLILPKNGFTQLNPEEIIKNQDKIELKERDTEFILKSFTQGLVDKWMELPTPEEQAALIIISQAIRVEAMNYLLVQIPKEIGKIVIKATIKVAQLILTEDLSALINEIEKISVDQAKKYLMDLLLQNEIRVGKGNLKEFSYPAYNGGWQKVIFPYIVTYRPLGSNSGEVGINIYSAKIIKTPAINLKYQWEGGIEELSPFIVRVSGKVEKVWVGFGFYYEWIEGPEIEVVFNEPVPNLRFKEPGFFDKLKNRLNEIETAFERAIEMISNIFGNFNPFQAALVPVGPEESLPELNLENLLPIAEKIEEVEEKLSTGTEETGDRTSEINLEEVQKMLEEIGKEIEITAQNIQEIAQQEITQEQGIGLEQGFSGQEGVGQQMVFSTGVSRLETQEQEPEPDVGAGSSSPEEEGEETLSLQPEPEPELGPEAEPDVGAGLEEEEQESELEEPEEEDEQLESEPEPEPEPGAEEEGIEEDEEEEPGEEIEEDEEEEEVEPSRIVVINEIAWMGTKAEPNDEWIELYNNTEQDINLFGWKLISSDNNPEIVFGLLPETAAVATTTIPTDGFYLLERTDDNAISDIQADWYGSFGYGLGNNPKCEILSLYDQNDNLIDQTTCLESGDWPAGKNVKIGEDWIRVSIERIDSSTTGSNSSNWANNNLITRNGKDANGNQINGTPRAKNSVSTSPTEISTALPFDEFNEITLTLLGSPYIVKGAIIVSSGKTLIIEPGVVLKFYDRNSGIEVNGTLNAIGGETKDKKIVFTSFKDSEYGGSGEPMPGDWKQIYFGPTSSDSELKNVIVKYGGEYYLVWPYSPLERAAIRVDQTSIVFRDSLLENNKAKGLYLINSPTTIVDNIQFIDTSTGVFVEGGSPLIENSLFKKNDDGIYIKEWRDSENVFYPATPIIENNIFEENETPISMINSSPSFKNNQVINNNFNGIITYGEIRQNTTWQADLTYLIKGALTIFKDIVLTLNPGLVVKFYNSYSEITVNGTLKAIGGEADNEKIVFTSFLDDEYGGDTNNDGSASSPDPGSWKQVYFSPTSLDSELDNVVIRYGGSPPTVWPYCPPETAAFRVDQSSITIKDSIFEYNQIKGLYLFNILSSTIIDNTFFFNHQIGCPYTIQSDAKALHIDGDSPFVQNSSFKENVYGIYIQNSDPFLENLIFGTGEEANNCNIFKDDRCVNPVSP